MTDNLNWGAMNRSELLIRYGFFKSGNYVKDDKTGVYSPAEGYKLNEKDALEEEAEISFRIRGKTGFPKPLKRFRLSWEMFDLSLEEPYFWVLEYLKQNFPEIDKIEDSFSAAENSAFFGINQTRLGGQQDKVSQFLATTGKMIKELFQMVRELRILDERLGYYDEVAEEVKKPINQRGKSAAITLKGMFVDLVQGGGKSAASVYGMARELEFITLPDLFFDAPPFNKVGELEGHIETLKANFNDNVLRVLVRHLRHFFEWRQRTAQEHKNRKRFMLKYLWQHYEIIQMYLTWVKPYLRHVAKLTLKEKNMQSPDIISAFEGSMLDIEILCKVNPKPIEVKGQKIATGYQCLLATFNYRTRPEMKVVQEGYQRGPVHIGRYEMNFRLYHWLEEDIEQYKKLKEKESWIMMGDVSESVQKAMDSLGEELEHYLSEAKGELHGKEEKSKVARPKGFMQRLFGDFYTSKGVKASVKKPATKKLSVEAQGAIKDFKKFEKSHASFHAWNCYHTFKKAHRMTAW